MNDLVLVTPERQEASQRADDLEWVMDRLRQIHALGIGGVDVDFAAAANFILGGLKHYGE